MHSDDVVISVRNVSKVYRLFDHPGDRVKQFVTFGMKKYHREFTALQDISLDVRRGEIVGIVGRNGSGKSTLLQIVSGILQPTHGKVSVCGRISALLELGAGFNSDFTGRENVYFHGALTGFSRSEMDARFDQIAAFADIGEFVERPVRTYSNGMFVRLAFAVAINLEPDILVVDEALAVGDAQFQAKCFKKIRSLCDSGGSILFVTHATDQVRRLCDRAILLDGGRLLLSSSPHEVVNRHISTMYSSPSERTLNHKEARSTRFVERLGYQAGECRFGNGAAEIIDYEVMPMPQSAETLAYTGGAVVDILFRVAFTRAVEYPTFAIAISTMEGTNLFGVNSRDLVNSPQASAMQKGDVVEARFSLRLNLARGEYLVSFSVSENLAGRLEPLDRRYDSVLISVDNAITQRGFVHMAPEFSLNEVVD